METNRINLASVISIMPNIERPKFTSSNSSEENSSSKWRYIDEELKYHLEPTKNIVGTTCYDKIWL